MYDITDTKNPKLITYLVNCLQKKNRAGQYLFLSKYKVFKARKHQTAVDIKILMLPFQERVTDYLFTENFGDTLI